MNEMNFVFLPDCLLKKGFRAPDTALCIDVYTACRKHVELRLSEMSVLK